jgi:radical SAM protein with 4Fe4S-binding SPASM domain
MEVVSYADFSAHLHRQMAAARVPANATIEVTRRCPLTCVHCYNNLPMGDQQALRTELNLEEHCRLIDEIVEAGCAWVLFTGGEIFARKDFLDIYTYAKRKGLLITLFTNGTLITPEIADYLAEWRPFNIEITLYGHTKETYERLTGKPGSYERCLRGIRLLQERNLPLKLKTVAVTLNKHEIQDMRRFAEDELGVEFRFDAMMSPRIDCSQSPLGVRLSPEDIVELDFANPERIAAFKEIHTRYSVGSPVESDEIYQCGGGTAAFAVDPEGKMSICTLSHFDTYDLRQGSFQDGWENRLRDVRRKKATRLTKCTACRMKATCGMCPANGELENLDPESPVDFLCQVSHLRALTFDLSVTPHGDCEYCEGGSGFEQLKESAQRLRRRAEENLLGLKLKRYLPIVAEQRSGAGCSSQGCSSELH